MSGTGINLIAVEICNLNAGSIAFTKGAASAARHQIQFQLKLLLFPKFNANRKYW
jgi:hypothetical protein